MVIEKHIQPLAAPSSQDLSILLTYALSPVLERHGVHDILHVKRPSERPINNNPTGHLCELPGSDQALDSNMDHDGGRDIA